MPELRPPVRHSDPPPWHELDPELFEDLCCDAHGLDPHIKRAVCYGTRGQAEKGIDLLADRHDGRREAGQCKRYKTFTNSVLDDAIDEFKKHLDHWTERRVMLLRIYVASEVRSPKVLDALHEYQEEFLVLGIELELCDGREVSRRLIPHRAIVSKYLDPHWTAIICGPLQATATIDFDHRLRGIEVQLSSGATSAGELADSLSTQINQRIDELHERYRCGERHAARDAIERITRDGAWSGVSSAVKSRALRLLALYTMNLDGDTSTFREIAGRADPDIADSTSRMLEALIGLRDRGEIPAAGDASPESLNLRAAALLEAGRAGDAVETLAPAGLSDVTEPESCRLLALGYLVLGELDRAREAVAKAVAAQPRWLSICEADAIIRFWEGAGTGSGLNANRYLPEPFPAELVRADDAAVRLISESAAQFKQLAGQTDDPHEQWRLRIWEFICLINAAPREPAEERCRSLLEDDPGAPMVLSWALSRRLPVDRADALESLEGATQDQPDYLDRVGLRVGLLLQAERADSALQVLEECAPSFIESGKDEALTHWKVQTLSALGRYEEGARCLELIADEESRQRLGLQIERAKAAETETQESLIRALEASYERFGGVDLLLEIVERRMSLSNGDSVESFAEDLLRRAPTPTAVRILATFRWTARRPRACLDLLDAQLSTFPGQELPEDLRRLRVLCLRKLGYLSEAIESARLIAQVEGTPEAFSNLLEAQIDHGDLPGIEVTGRLILAAEDATQPALLRAVGMVGVSSPGLAKQLWQRALAQGPLEDDLVLAAYTLGNSISASDAELAPLASRIGEIAESDSDLVQAFSTQDAVSMMSSARQRQEEVHAKYERAEVPVHVLPEAHRPSILAAFSVASPARSGSLDPLAEPAVLARHGGWPLRTSTPLRGALLLDVTSLIVAASLEVLEHLVDAFDSVLIPRATQRLLLHEISRLRPSQPHWSAAVASALQRVRSGGISVVPEPIPWSADKATAERMGLPWVARIEEICAQSALLVEFLPLTAHDGQSTPPAVPAALIASLTSPRAVAVALRDGGALSETDLQGRLARMGSSAGPENGATQPHSGQRLFVSSSVAELLSEADLLNACCDYFDLAMYADERDRLQAEVAGDSRRAAIADWGQTLVEDVQRKLNQGDLSFISPVEGGDPPLPQGSLTVDCLLDLLRSDSEAGVACCDDRFVNSRALMGRLPSTSIPDLIATLHANGRLSRQAYFDALDKMRRANLRFVPFSSEEVMYWLRKSRVRRGLVVETEQLTTLRSWWAGCCSQLSALQKPGERPDGSSEAALLLNCRRAIADAMQEIWSARRTSLETQTARARWLLDAMFVGLVEIQHHMPATDDLAERAPVLAGVDIALLSTAALSLNWRQPTDAGRRSAAEDYLGWLVESYTEPILAIDPRLSESAAASIRDFLIEMFEEIPRAERPATLLLLRRFVEELPAVLREELGKDSRMTQSFGLRSQEALQVAGHQFGFKEFWESAASAVNGQRGRVRPLEGGYYLTLLRAEGSADPPLIEIRRADSSVDASISDPMMGILSAARSERIAALDQAPHWVDGDPRSTAEIADVLERLGAIERVEMVRSLIDRSAADHYHRLEVEFERDHRVSIDQIAPQYLDRIATYFRLTGGGRPKNGFMELWVSAAESLVSELGLTRALDRVLCIPSRVPQSVVDQLDELGETEAYAALRAQVERSYCPISLLNVLSVSARTTLDGPWRASVSRDVIRKLGGADFHADFEFTKAIALRLEARTAAIDASPEMRPEVRLAVIWGHAATVVNLLRRKTSASDDVTAWIRQSATEAASLFRPNRIIGQDFWAPNRIAAAHLLFDGLASASHGLEIEAAKDDLKPLGALLHEFPDPVTPWMLHVLADPSLRTDLLLSNMTRAREQFVELFGEDSARFTSTMLEEQTEQAIIRLESDPTAAEPWLEIAAVVGDLPIYPRLRNRFKTAIEGVSLVALRRDNWNPLMLALSVRAAAVSADGSEPTILAFVAELEDVLLRLEQTDDGEEEDRVLEQIVEAVYIACLGFADRASLRSAFFSNLTQLFRCSRRLCEVMVPAIVGLRRNLPTDLRADLSELLFVCRSRARPGTFS